MVDKETISGYCIYCLEDVDAVVETKEEEITWKNTKLRCLQKTAYCPMCGNEVYVGEVHNFNLFSIYDAYRKAHNIISLEEVKKLVRQYEGMATPQELSIALGLHEDAIDNYLKGYIPSKKISRKLRRAFKVVPKKLLY